MSGLKLIDGSLAESVAVVFPFVQMLDTFNDRADVQEQFIASFVTVSGGRAVVGGFFVTNVVSCSCVVCVSELEVSWIFFTLKSFLCIPICFCNFQYICNVWFQ